jgi:hypothetical protein
MTSFCRKQQTCVILIAQLIGQGRSQIYIYVDIITLHWLCNLQVLTHAFNFRAVAAVVNRHI